VLRSLFLQDDPVELGVAVGLAVALIVVIAAQMAGWQPWLMVAGTLVAFLFGSSWRTLRWRAKAGP
jgi:CHASE2 domain-containing sensor protein